MVDRVNGTGMELKFEQHTFVKGGVAQSKEIMLPKKEADE